VKANRNAVKWRACVHKFYVRQVRVALYQRRATSVTKMINCLYEFFYVKRSGIKKTGRKLKTKKGKRSKIIFNIILGKIVA